MESLRSSSLPRLTKASSSFLLTGPVLPVNPTRPTLHTRMIVVLPPIARALSSRRPPNGEDERTGHTRPRSRLVPDPGLGVAPSPGYVLGVAAGLGVQAGLETSPDENIVQHGRGDTAGECVLLTRVIAAD